MTVAATNTITTPPATPDRNRQQKNQLTERGKAQATKVAVISTIIRRKICSLGSRLEIGRPISAPTRYPARLAEPRYMMADVENQWAWINAGISGV